MQNSKPYSRREMLRLGAGSLLALGLWPGALRAAGKGQPRDFSFIVVNDIHYFDSHCGDWLQGALHKMKSHPERPDFCLIAGDLAENGTPVQFAAVRDLFKTLGIPVYCVPGNHDYLTYRDRKAYEQIFPDSINYHFEHKDWQFVALDTTMGQTAYATQIQPPTLAWVDATLPGLDKSRPTIILTHFPLGDAVIVRPTNADQLLDRFRDFNLQAVFSGHWHGFTERQIRETTLTTNKCCSFRSHNHDGTKEKGYFLCQTRDGAVSRTFVQVG
jgi:3',5'-cyclic AMP phosphodiesterase CpdA